MRCIKAILLLCPTLVSGVIFNLTHQRDENTFYLTCGVLNGTIDPHNVTFWINETEKIDILRLGAERVSWVYNIVAFKLEPQDEGTFFCGDVEGEESNGLGPFAGKLLAS